VVVDDAMGRNERHSSWPENPPGLTKYRARIIAMLKYLATEQRVEALRVEREALGSSHDIHVWPRSVIESDIFCRIRLNQRGVGLPAAANVKHTQLTASAEAFRHGSAQLRTEGPPEKVVRVPGHRLKAVN